MLKYSKKSIENNATKQTPVMTTKSSKINLNSLTIKDASSSFDGSSGDDDDFSRAIKNPFKNKTNDKEQLLVNSTEGTIKTKERKLTRQKIYEFDSQEKAPTIFETDSSDKKQLIAKTQTRESSSSSSSSSSSASASTSPSVKRESDSELQSLNVPFLQKKRLKQSPSVESLSSIASSKKSVKEEPQKKVSNLQKIKSSSIKSSKLVKETNKSKRCKINSNENENDTTLPLEAKRIESDKTLQKLNSYIEKRKKDMETRKMLENKKKEIEKLHDADVDQQNSESTNSDDLNSQLTSNCSNSSDIGNDDEVDDDTDIVYLDSKKSNKKEFNYEIIDFDETKENEIDKLK